MRSRRARLHACTSEARCGFTGGALLAHDGRPMTRKQHRAYEPRYFDGRIIESDEIERIHKEVLEFESIEAIADPMRELIEDLWPELVYKLPPKRPHS
jgi:hypothetical protein